MADCMPGEIWIGGTVRAADVAELCAAIGQEGVSLEWGSIVFHAESAEDLLAARVDYNQALVLHLCDDQARYGQFEQLEKFLQEHGIPYDRQSDGKYEYDPLFVQFRRGGALCEQLTDHSGNPTIRTEPLYEVAAKLAAAVSSFHQGAWQAAQDAVETAYHQLHAQLPPAVPSLATFNIA